MDNEKSIKIDFMKVIVALLVVIAHSTRMYTPNGAIQGYYENNILDIFTSFIYGFHMPLFFCLSGFVYSICIEKCKYSDKSKFLKNKFMRLIVPYFILGIFYVAPCMILLDITKLSYLEYILKGITLGEDPRHLWYLTTLFFIFAISIFMRPKTKKQEFFSLMLSGILVLISAIFDNIPAIVSNLLNYTIFFYIGYIINNEIKIFEMLLKKIKMLPILLLIIYIIVFLINTPEKVLKLIGTVTFFTILYSIPTRLYKGNIILNKLSNYGMGIYLFHPMIIYYLYYFALGLNINPYVQSFIIAIISIALSISFTFIIRKLRLSIIIGENK